VHEAEYYAYFQGNNQAKFLISFFSEIGIPIVMPLPIQLDSSSAEATVNSWRVTQRSRQIDVHCHVSRDMRERGQTKPSHVESEENSSDVLTKPFGRVDMAKARERMLVPITFK
jgi:hypothetical protein